MDRYNYGFINGLILGNVLSGAFLLVFALTHLPFVAVLTMIISSGLGVFHSIGYDVMMAKISENRFRATIYSGMMAVWNGMFIIGLMSPPVYNWFFPELVEQSHFFKPESFGS
ncbi:hypothetical protein CSTERTH_00900 [Thermoclostridium stercorarium subsp. thermolacticum DSM 2910]|uniref:Uncharacterized protein n=1 Tax=Thermoclostridium stercorarium subsp. thermolacticum DSM 2910 TaxID=1121336 RepID=A0A1B1YAB5_THEST|nr:hypothetical protein CSTERTH_00900 [Thermoclostridium stercorarium subsp. thermolacticum DSM 2910]